METGSYSFTQWFHIVIPTSGVPSRNDWKPVSVILLFFLRIAGMHYLISFIHIEGYGVFISDQNEDGSMLHGSSHDDVIKQKHFSRYRWIPLTKASDAEFWCFRCLNKRLLKQSRRRWFECHRAHYDVTIMNMVIAYELAKPVARTSAAMMMTLIAHNIFIIPYVLIGWVFLVNKLVSSFKTCFFIHIGGQSTFCAYGHDTA